MTLDFPTEFAEHTRRAFGAAGSAWLAQLPEIIAECAGEWGLRVGPPLTSLSWNWVAPARRLDGREVILKIGLPQPEFLCEMEALACFDGPGMVRLLAMSRERGAVLLERVVPGTPLSSLPDDDEATRIAAGVMRQLRRPAPAAPAFPTTVEWAAALARFRARHDGGTGPVPRRLFAEAEALFADLHATQGTPVLLHGDLHHDNILLAAEATWLAIDPKGVIGEPEYETGALLRNPLPRILRTPRLTAVLGHRIDHLAELLGFDRARIRGWAVAQAVLAGVWDDEDSGGDWRQWLPLAEALAAIRE